MEALEVLGIMPAVILQVRSPAEVTQSLKDRDDLYRGLAQLLWPRSVTQAEWTGRQCPRVWVSFRQMITDWRGTVDRIGDGLKIAWPIQPDDAAQRIELPLNPRQRQVVPPVEDGMVACAWLAIQAGLANDESGVRAGFDRVRISLRKMDRLDAPAMSHDLSRLEAELQALRTSTCWRLTAPPRLLKIAYASCRSAPSRRMPLFCST